MSIWGALASAESDRPQVVVETRARFVRAAAGRAVVNLDGAELQVSQIGRWPQPGETVAIAQLGGAWYCLGAANPLEEWGRVVTPGSGSAVVEVPNGSGKTYTLLLPKGVTAAANDVAHVSWSNNGVVLALFAGSPVQPDAPGSNPGGGVEKTDIFTAEWSGTPNASGYWWTHDIVSQSGSGPTRGAWRYSSIKSAIPAGRTVTKARIFLPMDAIGSPLTFGYHTLAAKSGIPDLLSGVTFTPSNGWVEISPVYGQVLAGGGAGQGLVLTGGASGSIVRGVTRDALSGALELTWK